MRMPNRKLLLTIVFLLVVSHLFSETVFIEEPRFPVGTEEEKEQVRNVLAAAAGMATGLYSDYFEVTWMVGEGAAEYSLEVNAIPDGRESVLSLIMKRVSDEAASRQFSLTGNVTDEKVKSEKSIKAIFDETLTPELVRAFPPAV